MEDKSKNNNNNIMSHVVVGFVGALVYFLYLWLISSIINNFPRPYINNGLSILDNVLMWVMLLVSTFVPMITAGVPGSKLKQRSISYAGLVGSIFGAFILWIAIDKNFGLFGIFIASLLTLINFNGIVDPDKKLPNYLYFAALGVWACLVNGWFINYFHDVYTYLMFVFLHVVPLIICGMKRIQWAWAYIVGWSVSCIISAFVFNALIGGYLFVVPNFLIMGVFYYIFKIWRKDIQVKRGLEDTSE